MPEDFSHLSEDEQLKAENDFLKMKLMLEQGAQFGTVHGNIDDLPKLIFEKQLLNSKGWFVLEHTPRNDYKKFPFYATERNYGTTIFSIFIENR